MKSLSDKMTELLKQEKHRKNSDPKYISGYTDGALDMYNISKKHIEETCHETKPVPNTPANQASTT